MHVCRAALSSATLLVPLCLIATLPACAPTPSEPGKSTGTIEGDVLIGGLRRSRPLTQALGPNGHHVIFVNFDGVTLLPNFDDSVNNQSSVVASWGRSVTFPKFNSAWYSKSKTRDQVIADVMSVLKADFADFNVDVVMTRPADPDYVMAVVGGMPTQIGQPCGGNGCVLGIAPLDCSIGGGGKIDYNSQGDVEVVFAFSDTAQYSQGTPYQSAINTLATTVAQETAHAYGLGHQSLKSDIMYPFTTGASAGFIDQASSYADNQNCANGRGTQNSHALLLAILGESMGPSDTTPPAVSFTAPVAGATVARKLTLKVDASDDTGVDHIVLSVTGPNGEQGQTLLAAPYQWEVTVPADGAYSASAIAVDAAGNQGMAQVKFKVGTVTVADGGSGPAPGEVGAACTSAAECNDHICADSGAQKFCTKACDPMVANTCPAGLFCLSQGADGYFCSFGGGRGSSGCAVASRAPTGGAQGLALLALLVLGVLPLRRRG